MAKSLRLRVWERANGRCEYCQLPQSCTTLPHELDHIRARQHRGRKSLANLCLACAACNTHKGPNVAGYDPRSGRLVPLFHPRRDDWHAHFAWRGAVLRG
jgi:5-methylcytosine-specific restriction endonuclease McrA